MMQREFLDYIALALFPCHDPKNHSAVTNGDYPGEWLVALLIMPFIFWMTRPVTLITRCLLFLSAMQSVVIVYYYAIFRNNK